jgi:hypothetical protein
MCISSTNERKTQVGWVVVIGQRIGRWVHVNNITPKGSLYCVSDSDGMTMKSLCLETSKKYIGDGRA